PVWTDRENLVAADVDHADLTHEDAGVGDVDHSVGTNRDVVEQHGTTRLEIDLPQRTASEAVESALDVDVGGPERVAMDRQALRCVEVNAIRSTDDEQL